MIWVNIYSLGWWAVQYAKCAAQGEFSIGAEFSLCKLGSLPIAMFIWKAEGTEQRDGFTFT